MTVLDNSLLTVILLLLLALAGVMVAWLRAGVRADVAEDLAVAVAGELRIVRRELKAARADVGRLSQHYKTANALTRQYRRRLAMYENPDRPITTVDQFLNDLFGGQR